MPLFQTSFLLKISFCSKTLEDSIHQSMQVSKGREAVQSCEIEKLGRKLIFSALPAILTLFSKV